MDAPMPPLRQPRRVETSSKQRNPSLFSDTAISNLILTLKNDKKLVVSSDAYNGIVKDVNMYECVFCEFKMELDPKLKELHNKTDMHKKVMNDIPFIEIFAENLLKEISKEHAYCTICHALIRNPFVSDHIMSEMHITELKKALERGRTYKPHLDLSCGPTVKTSEI